jgi:protein Mpv17
MAQQGVEQVGLKNHDLARSARMALYGGGTYPLTPGLDYNAD